MPEIATDQRNQHPTNGPDQEEKEKSAVVQREWAGGRSHNGVFSVRPVEPTQCSERTPKSRDPHPNEPQHPKATVLHSVVQKVVVNLASQRLLAKYFPFQLTLVSRVDHLEVTGPDSGHKVVIDGRAGAGHALESKDHGRGTVGHVITVHIRPGDQRGHSPSQWILHGSGESGEEGNAQNQSENNPPEPSTEVLK